MFFDFFMNKRLVIVLFLIATTIQLAFPQCEIKAGDYYAIKYCVSHEEEVAQNSISRHHHRQKLPYDIYDIRIVSFDSQMNCMKSHIYMVHREKWAPEIIFFPGETICIDDSTIAYTSKAIINEPNDLTRALMRCTSPYDIMGELEEEFVLCSATIRMGNTLIMYKLDDLHLKRSHYRELKRILKLCGLQLKNNIIIYPN